MGGSEGGARAPVSLKIGSALQFVPFRRCIRSERVAALPWERDGTFQVSRWLQPGLALSLSARLPACSPHAAHAACSHLDGSMRGLRRPPRFQAGAMLEHCSLARSMQPLARHPPLMPSALRPSLGRQPQPPPGVSCGKSASCTPALPPPPPPPPPLPPC
jgi:hypothetical protein